MNERADNVEQAKAKAVEYENLREQLAHRCDSAKIQWEEIKSDLADIFGLDRYLVVSLPNGREKRRVSLYANERIREFLSISFEEYSFLGDFLAICSYSKNSIEAGVRPLGSAMPTSLIKRRLYGTTHQEQHEEGDEEGPEDGQPIVLINPAGEVREKVVLGQPFQRIWAAVWGSSLPSEHLSL